MSLTWPGTLLQYRNEKLQLSRLLARPSDPPLTSTQASSRISSQLSLSQKLSYATQVIDNSGSVTDLSGQIDRLVQRWKHQQGGSIGWWWLLCWLIPPLGLLAGAICLVQTWFKSKRLEGKGRRRARGEVEKRRGRGGREEMIELQDRGGRRRMTSGSSEDM